MDKNTMIKKLLEKYSNCGVTEEEVTYMIETGVDNDLEPEIIFANADMQLAEEHLAE